MILKTDLSALKKNIEANVGKKVRLTSNKGRKKTEVKEGILVSSYSNIFVVQFDNGQLPSNCVSYSYTDVLTDTIELQIC